MLDRIIAHTPLGQEQLLFRSLDGIEALSTPFDFSIELLSTDARLDRKALLGQPLTLEIPTQGFLSAPRYLNGKITAMAVSAVELTAAPATRCTSLHGGAGSVADEARP